VEPILTAGAAVSNRISPLREAAAKRPAEGRIVLEDREGQAVEIF
jgi:hypothetical protein